jgi:hypothetical protein
LLSRCKALGSISSTTKINKQEDGYKILMVRMLKGPSKLRDIPHSWIGVDNILQIDPKIRRDPSSNFQRAYLQKLTSCFQNV